ncbi:MAG: hypothetical protein GY679_00485 [Mycoplasma sp.]|nr:hypothetical protein [Mycoplasma sp.]
MNIQMRCHLVSHLFIKEENIIQLLKKLQNEVNLKIQSCKWIEKDGNKFLEIIVNEPSLDKITNISHDISKYLDIKGNIEENYFLDIISKGTEEKISFKDISSQLNKNIKIKLKKLIKDKLIFEGELIDIKEEYLIIKWNAKGQFRKTKLDKNNIKEIYLSAKIKKEKK